MTVQQLFSGKEERFDDVFERVLTVLRAKDPNAQLRVCCECASCSECKRNERICGRTLFFDSTSGKNWKTKNHVIRRIYHLHTPDQKRVHFEVQVVSNDPGAEQFLLSIKPQMVREMSRVSINKLTALRDAVVESSLLSSDIASFCYRALKKIQLISDFGGGSVFIQDSKTEKIELSATTGIARVSNRTVLKKDIYYFPDGKSYTAKCFNSGFPKYERNEKGLRKNTFGENEEFVYNRTYFPIQLRGSSATAKAIGHERVGVLRVVNIRKNGLIQPPSMYDVFLFGYFCEFICILSRLYQKASNPFGVLERATHGFIHDLAIISGRVGMFNKTSLEPFVLATHGFVEHSSSDSSEVARFRGWLSRFVEEFELYQSDMLGVVESMAAQLHSVLDTTEFSAGRLVGTTDERVDQPYREVFVRLEKATPFMARSHNKSAPSISYRCTPQDTDYRFMPSLDIDPEVFYLAMRNLFENSIKYQRLKSGSSNILVHWRRESGRVIFDISDNGVGIRKDEVQYLFRPGFRGREAVLMSTRGNGIGLAYLKQALQTHGGDVMYSGSGLNGHGSKFSVVVEETRE